MISLHINVDFCPPERLDRALLYLKRTKQRSVNIAGGAQMDRLTQFIERVRLECPTILIHMRILEDTGIVIKLTPDEWYNRYIAPRVLWLKANKVITVVDNETSGGDDVIRAYVQRSSIIADMLHAVSLNGDFCRFATGNIQDGSQPGQSNQYPLLKPLFAHLNAGDWISPNEYSNRRGKSSAGHLERYKRIIEVAGKPLNISIGECGILDNYQARNGYLNFTTGSDAAAQLLGDDIWYNGGQIDRHWYVIGGNDDWKSCQVNDEALQFLEGFYTKNAPPVNIPPVTQPPPPPPTPAPNTVPVAIEDLKAMQFALKANISAVQNYVTQLTSHKDSLQSILNWVDKLLIK